MSRWTGFLGVALVMGIVLWFSALNGNQRITLDLGFIVLYRFPVTMVAFGGLCLGMFVMLFAGIHSDLRVRRILRERLAEEARQERFVDRDQRDLFQDDEARS